MKIPFLALILVVAGDYTCWKCYSDNEFGYESNPGCKANKPDPDSVNKNYYCTLGCAVQSYTVKKGKQTFDAIQRSCLSRYDTPGLLTYLDGDYENKAGCKSDSLNDLKADLCYRTCQSDLCNTGSGTSIATLSAFSAVVIFLMQ